MDIHKTLNMFAEPNRLRILSILYEQDLTVNDIAEILQLKQANTSRHLAKLSEEGLVKSTKCKKYVIYSIDDEYRKECMIMAPVINVYRSYDTGKEDLKRLNELIIKKIGTE